MKRNGRQCVLKKMAHDNVLEFNYAWQSMVVLMQIAAMFWGWKSY